MRRRRSVLLSLLLLAGILAVPFVWTWREVRQQRLNKALIKAVDHNDVTIVRQLLRQGANPDAQVLSDDKRPWWKRAWDLLRQGSLHQQIPTETALTKAIDWPPPIPPFDVGSARPDYEASMDRGDVNNAVLAEALIAAGADVNMHVASNNRDANWAATRLPWSTPLIEAAHKRRWHTMQVLLAHGAQVNARNGEGTTALMYTAFGGNMGMVETLFRQGANINAQSDDGSTPLVCLLMSFPIRGKEARSSATELKMVAYLLRHGASVNARTADGLTAMTFARATDNKLLSQMLKHAAAK